MKTCQVRTFCIIYCLSVLLTADKILNLQTSWYLEVTLYSCRCSVIGLWWATKPNPTWSIVGFIVIMLVMMLPIIAAGRDFFKLSEICDNKSSSASLNAKIFSIDIWVVQKFVTQCLCFCCNFTGYCFHLQIKTVLVHLVQTQHSCSLAFWSKHSCYPRWWKHHNFISHDFFETIQKSGSVTVDSPFLLV